jgi:Ca2+-binding EF-hand superfamily protein
LFCRTIPIQGLRRKGAHIAETEVQRLMASVDLDGSNTLDFDEFLTGDSGLTT